MACCRHRKKRFLQIASCAAAVTAELQVLAESEEFLNAENDQLISEGAPPPVDPPQSAIEAQQLRWQVALVHWEEISKLRNRNDIAEVATENLLQGDEDAVIEYAIGDELRRGAEATAFAGAWRQALWVLNRAEKWEVEVDMDVYKDVLRACVAAQRPRPAFFVLDSLTMMQNPDVETYDIVVSAILSSNWGMGRRGRRGVMADPILEEEMTEMVEEMWEFLEDALLDDFEEVSEDLEAAKAEWEAAMVVSGRARKSRTSREGHWELALDNFDKMLELTLAQDALTYEALMTACMHSARWQECLHLMEEASNQGFGAEKGLHRATIVACVNAQQPETAIRVLEEARQQGVSPDPITYEAAIRCCSQTGKDAFIPQLRGEAYEALRTILARSTESGQVARGESEGSKAVGALIGCFCIAGQLGQWEMGLSLLESMPALGFLPTAKDFNVVISECYRAGQGITAADLFDEMHDRRLQPNLMSSHIAMLQHVSTGQWMISKNIYAEITKTGQCPRWIKSLMRIDVSGLPGEVAELATCIFLEEVCRKPKQNLGKVGRDLVISTHREDRDTPTTVDEYGMDSPMKRRMYRFLTDRYRLEVDALSPGEITIPKKEFDKVLQRFYGIEPAEKRRKKTVDMHLARHRLAFLPQSARGQENE